MQTTRGELAAFGTQHVVHGRREAHNTSSIDDGGHATRGELTAFGIQYVGKFTLIGAHIWVNPQQRHTTCT